MAYRAITKRGEEFILNRCISASTFGSDRFKGKRNFPLPKSTTSENTIWISNAKNDQQLPISTPEELAKNLINWFNRYSKEYALDANIIAAQAYAESNYNLWIYSDGGAMGVTQFLDVAVYDTIVKNKQTFEQEVDDILNNLSGDKNDIRYLVPNITTINKKILSTPDTAAVAKQNRQKLFQNIIDNPKIMIKAHCFLMSQIGQRNNNLASSSLFAYNRGGYLTSKTYDEIISKTQQRYGSKYIEEGLNYVNRIFNILAGEEPLLPKSKIDPNKRISFGYEIDLSDANLKYFNLIDTVKIGGATVSKEQEVYIQTLHPVAQSVFRDFIFNIEQQLPFKVEITSAYRSFEEQAKVQKDNQAYNPPRPAADPGYSYHNYGLALDIALQSTSVNQVRYSFNASVSQWEQTGVIKIADALHLTWGGSYGDVVHFDLSNKYKITDCLNIAKNTFGNDPNKIQGNQIPLSA